MREMPDAASNTFETSTRPPVNSPIFLSFSANEIIAGDSPATIASASRRAHSNSTGLKALAHRRYFAPIKNTPVKKTTATLPAKNITPSTPPEPPEPPDTSNKNPIAHSFHLS
ncbi:MAG: hypothetical protein M3494_04430 [Actinomycetota bacterium]|jgi:hypothetical protein|nr:hypothetical protein [Rubrobacter sp.]MDQ3507251.1 hypothetical protein [Actinomycetota bacterium]